MDRNELIAECRRQIAFGEPDPDRAAALLNEVIEYVSAVHDKARREELRLKIERWINCEPVTYSTGDLLQEMLAYLRGQPS